jgi:hypothetical protein
MEIMIIWGQFSVSVPDVHLTEGQFVQKIIQISYNNYENDIINTYCVL